MPYCTVADVQAAVRGPAKLVELTDDLNEGGDGDPYTAAQLDVANKAIRTADGVINSYVGHRYAVPLSPVPDTISTLSAEWAARVLRRRGTQGMSLQDDLDQEKVDREWLDGIARGVYSLGVEPTPGAASIVSDDVGVRDSTLTVSRERMKDFI